MLFNGDACGVLLARAERAGAACWDAAPLLACEDRGGSFRLAISTPDASAAAVEAGDLRQCDWVEVEQILLAPERANEVAALTQRIGIPLAFPVRFATPSLGMRLLSLRSRSRAQTTRSAWATVRPRAGADALRALPAWRLLETLPSEADADSDRSASPELTTIDGFPLCTEDGRVQTSACHAGAYACGRGRYASCAHPQL